MRKEVSTNSVTGSCRASSQETGFDTAEPASTRKAKMNICWTWYSFCVAKIVIVNSGVTFKDIKAKINPPRELTKESWSFPSFESTHSLNS